MVPYDQKEEEILYQVSLIAVATMLVCFRTGMTTQYAIETAGDLIKQAHKETQRKYGG